MIALRKKLVDDLQEWFDEPVAVQLREPWALIEAQRDPSTAGYVEIRTPDGEVRGSPVGSAEARPVLVGVMEASTCRTRIVLRTKSEKTNAQLKILLHPDNISFVTLVEAPPKGATLIKS